MPGAITAASPQHRPSATKLPSSAGRMFGSHGQAARDPSYGTGRQTSGAKWCLSHRADKAALPLADRHYNRQKVGSPQFVPPGRCVVLLTGCQRALWVTSWPFAEYVRHAWPGAWVCSLFRNEGAGRASELIREAVAATRSIYGDPPSIGMITFISRKHVRPTRVRGRDVWGWTWLKAGFEHVGETKGGLMAIRLAPENMPEPAEPMQMQQVLL